MTLVQNFPFFSIIIAKMYYFYFIKNLFIITIIY